MLVIRLFRVGKKHQPSFKIVVTDKRKPPRGGRFVEKVGSWSPLTKEKKLKAERIKYWMSVGAKPSNSVYNLLLEEKILEGKKIPVHKKKKGEKEAEKPKEAKPEEKKPEEKKEAKVEKVKEEKKVEEKKSDKEPQKEQNQEKPKEATSGG